MGMALTLNVPDVLAGDVRDVESLYALAYPTVASVPAETYVLDMGSVGFAKPYGVTTLLLVARRLAAISGRPVELTNLSKPVQMYLDRMNLFEIGAEWVRPASRLADGWDRNPQTRNLLELTIINGPEDVLTAITRADRVFSRWLSGSNLGDLLRVLSELCANVHQHSGDPQGCVMIQKYEETVRERTVVCVSVADLGVGVSGSLVARHGEIGYEPLDYLREAMGGRTARPNDRGGLGLRITDQIAHAAGGYLWLRSDTAAILSRNPEPNQSTARGFRDLARMPGTQVAVELYAPLST